MKKADFKSKSCSTIDKIDKNSLNYGFILLNFISSLLMHTTYFNFGHQ